MRESGFITLPSEYTLWDYTHAFKTKPGIQEEANEQLGREAKLEKLETWQTHVCLVMDKVKVKEGLVYDKHILGFDLGSVDNHLDELLVQIMISQLMK